MIHGDLSGAIEALRSALEVDPDNFHHWMWLGKMRQQAGDPEGSANCAREALRCLDQAPNHKLSREERARLVVRASLFAGDRERAIATIEGLERAREPEMAGCLVAGSFEGWREADAVAAPTFQTIVELRRCLGDATEAVRRYERALEHGLELAAAAEAKEGLHLILRRLETIRAGGEA